MITSVRDISTLVGSSEPVADCNIDTLLIDSRSLTAAGGTLFFAIQTSGNDGHRYVESLYRRGVRNFVVNRIPEGMESVSDANMLLVEDTEEALMRVGAMCRHRFRGKVLAITGSRGKTTLKEWLFHLMGNLTDIGRSPRSYNSHIGVPLSLWRIDPESDLAIIEAGVSHEGEMKRLERIIQPDVVIFTNLSDDHSGGFSSEEKKAEEKALLAAGDSTKAIIYNLDSPLLREAIERIGGGKELISWSASDSNATLFLRYERLDSSHHRVIYTYKGQTSSFRAPLSTAEDLENASNTLAFMLYWGVGRDEIADSFASMPKLDIRIKVTEGVNGCSIIFDPYTADFSSLTPALDVMRRRAMPGQSSTLILSDLSHEGSEGEDIYAETAEAVRRAGITRFIGVGRKLRETGMDFGKNVAYFDTTDQLLEVMSPSDFSNEIILLKGAPDFGFKRILNMLEARTHETVLEVNLDAMMRNYNYFRKQVPPGTGIVAMVKASGYGAGSREIAKTLQDCGAAYLAVAVLDEGIDLRNNGITMPIMVMNPKVVNYKEMFAHRLEPEIYSMEMLHDVIREARKNNILHYPIHIKLDTGMHRMGFIEEELPELMNILENHEEVEARSVFSHLATADCPDMNDYTQLQLSRFSQWTEYMLSRSKNPILRHILNTAGILRYPQYHYDMVRLGIGLYGANTLPPEMEEPLSVVSTLRTVIIAIREWEAGESIGYGRRSILQRKSKIATIPIGYADGMNRHFGRGTVTVKVNGHDCPTIGNICMDACMIDVTGVDCQVGDYVEIFGEEAPLQRLADVLDTIPYEVLTSVSPRVKRIYYRE
ncbi:MAG: bifunctional UDP-N-acetylmuramoyl-tripeptide:D-alanyl-D-alanine ligase/alanine racemase [Bacteroidales bacterium]|nr:bifunctional UDP-N-acetylmuramoyl-tripeptide:D-alanyl-D-alanine ligase/alanine racemase [Bacteroidales bacterium]